uniref:Putative site-specific DNA endonuclease n=1 Tax=Rhexinema sarcinoideum TaxID=43261 RepID=A0A1B2RYS7_9CHLO|nr:putative site-specific DNA endonuclease [Rhexinema sarcinoideum]
MRLKLEKNLIEKTPSNLLYNPKNTPHNFQKKPRIAQRVKIHATIYSSIAEASRILKKSSRTIRLKLDDPLNFEYERLEYHRHIYFDEYAVEVDGQFYSSTNSVVEAGLAKTTRQVRDRCRSAKWKNWLLVKKGRTTIPRGSRVKFADPK